MRYPLFLIMTILLTYFGCSYDYYSNKAILLSNSSGELFSQDNTSQVDDNNKITFSKGRVSLPWWMLVGFLLLGIMVLLLFWSALPEKTTKNKGQSLGQFPESETVDNPILTVQTLPRDNLDTIPELITQLREIDYQQRREVIWELARRGDSRAVKPLVDLMLEANSYERSLILEALSEISTKTLKPMNHALVLFLQDENPQVRKNAIRDLTKLYELINQIRPIIYHALDDNDPEVREVAKWALTQFNPQQISLGNIPIKPPAIDTDLNL
jgi:vesicle coat complex subunit